MNKESGWQLHEDGPEAYEKYIVPAFSEAWAQDIIKRASLNQGERIIDIACGTGIVARCAYKTMVENIHITGVDINEVVINKAQNICPTETTSIEWKISSVEALPFSDAVFNVILCQQGLQYFPDRIKALKEVYRVLAEKGRVFFSVWRSLGYFPFYLALQKALKRYVSETASSMLSSAFSLDDTALLRGLFESVGFKNIKICLEIKQMRYPSFSKFIIGGFAASPFGTEISELEESIREEMFQLIKESVSNYIDDYGLAAPMETYVVSAEK